MKQKRHGICERNVPLRGLEELEWYFSFLILSTLRGIIKNGIPDHFVPQLFVRLSAPPVLLSFGGSAFSASPRILHEYGRRHSWTSVCHRSTLGSSGCEQDRRGGSGTRRWYSPVPTHLYLLSVGKVKDNQVVAPHREDSCYHDQDGHLKSCPQ